MSQPAPKTKVASPAPPAAWSRIVAFFGERWFSIDLRTLGLFRIALGIVLLGNLYQHTADGRLVAFLTNDGVLTNHFALFAPIQPRVWSFLFALSTPAEVTVGCLAILIVYLLFLVGWKTKAMQIAAPICFISMINRNLFLQDGGSFVTTILLVWTAFLPLGARLSLDSWRRGGSDAAAVAATAHTSTRHGHPAHTSFVCLALLIQLAFIYGLNAAHKAGPTWGDGSAVHYILWQNSGNTVLGGWLRHHEPAFLSPLLTWGTLAFEWAAPVLILTPVLQLWSRRILMAAMFAFHSGIAVLISLGTFSYVMIAYSTLFVSAADWDVIERVVPRWVAGVRRRLPPRLDDWLSRLLAALRGAGRTAPVVPAAVAVTTPTPPWLSPTARRRLRRAGIGLREAVFALIFVASMAELSVVNQALPPSLRLQNRPRWMADIVYYLRIYEIWAMFSPDPPLDNGRLIVDATLADGSHYDPLTGAPPDFDAPLGGPYLFGHDWAEYMAYYPWDRHRAYRFGFRDYVLNLMRNAPPERQLQRFDVYFVSALSPKPGETTVTGYKKELLLSHPGPPGS